VSAIDQQDRTNAIVWLQENLGSTERDIAQLDQLAEMLVEESDKQNLVSRPTLPFLWSRHFLDSAQLLKLVPRGTAESTDKPRIWLDLGTGAGFPGLVCALLEPKTSFILVEQRPLRTDWLQRVVDRLEMDNVEVRAANISAIPPFPADVISARAFAPLPRLLKLSAAFSTSVTQWALPKGRSAEQELQELTGWRHMFHVEHSVTDPQSGIIIGNLLGPKRRSG